MEEQKKQIKEWLDTAAQENYGEFGFSTCSEEQQVEIVYQLVNSILYAKGQ